MKSLSPKLQLGLEDLLADLCHARRTGDLGRLVLLSYYEVRRWAKLAGELLVAEHSAVLLNRSPYADRTSFMADVDRLIVELETLRASTDAPAGAPTPWQTVTRVPEAPAPQVH